MNTDPTRDPECICPWIERTDPWAQPESWTYYFEQREYDPRCPEHGGGSTAGSAARQLSPFGGAA